MSLSIQKMVSDGTLSTVVLGIEYLQRNDIYMRIGGVETPQSGAPNGYTWSFLDNNTIRVLPVVPAGVEVVIYRRTDLDAMYNIYSQNAQFDESTIDENNQQLLYIAQEYFETEVRSAFSYIGDEPPTQTLNGTEWYCTTDGRSYIWYEDDDSGQWVESSPQSITEIDTTALRNELASSAGSSLVGFQQDGAGSVSRTAQDKMRETVSVQDFGGDVGSPDNSAALVAAQAESEVVQLPRGNYSIGTTPPDFNVAGSGVLVANGVETSAGEVGYNPELEIFAHTPKDYQREHLGITYPPPPFQTAPGTQKRCRTIYSLGSQLGDKSKVAGYVTAFGNFNGANFNQWFAVDAFGGDTLMYAYNVERTVAVGSESLAWFGAPSSQYLIDYRHDWWRKPSSNPYLPGDPLWNPNGLATIFPTLSAEIGSYSAYATSTADASHTVAVGRDAGNHTVKGTHNVFVGYSAAQDLYAGDRNVAVGSLSMQGSVFATQITAVGRESGRYCKDSVDAVFIGHGAGRTVQNASRSVFVGPRAADGVVDGVGAVIIGHEAGKGHASLNDVLAISNASHEITNPLIGGRFDAKFAGVNADPALMRAKWHVRNFDSGSTLTPAVGVLVEGALQAAVTVETSNTGYCGYRFADPENSFIGGMEYSHSSDSMSFFVNGASRWRIIGDGHFHPMVDNTYSVGIASLRASVVYAGTGTINTSDAREKTTPLAIDDAVLDAWGDVQLISFQWLNAIQEKGEDVARWHFGVIAQQVRDAFAARGLDGTRYGLLCYDEWGDEFEDVIDDEGNKTGEQRLVRAAGNRWGIRPDQCLFLEAAYQRRRCDRIEARLTSAGL